MKETIAPCSLEPPSGHDEGITLKAPDSVFPPFTTAGRKIVRQSASPAYTNVGRVILPGGSRRTESLPGLDLLFGTPASHFFPYLPERGIRRLRVKNSVHFMTSLFQEN